MNAVGVRSPRHGNVIVDDQRHASCMANLSQYARLLDERFMGQRLLTQLDQCHAAVEREPHDLGDSSRPCQGTVRHEYRNGSLAMLIAPPAPRRDPLFVEVYIRIEECIQGSPVPALTSRANSARCHYRLGVCRREEPIGGPHEYADLRRSSCSPCR